MKPLLAARQQRYCTKPEYLCLKCENKFLIKRDKISYLICFSVDPLVNPLLLDPHWMHPLRLQFTVCFRNDVLHLNVQDFWDPNEGIDALGIHGNDVVVQEVGLALQFGRFILSQFGTSHVCVLASNYVPMRIARLPPRNQFVVLCDSVCLFWNGILYYF